MGPNFTYGFFWLMNYVFDHNAGFLDRITLLLSNLMILAPFASIVGVFIASSAYGTDVEVALGTDWAITIEDDSKYTLMFNLTALLAILNFSWAFMSRGSLVASYDEKIEMKAESERIARGDARDLVFSGDCDIGFVEDPKTGLCYYPEDKDWDWDTDTARL
jgi:hypothetical protein